VLETLAEIGRAMPMWTQSFAAPAPAVHGAACGSGHGPPRWVQALNRPGVPRGGTLDALAWTPTPAVACSWRLTPGARRSTGPPTTPPGRRADGRTWNVPRAGRETARPERRERGSARARRSTPSARTAGPAHEVSLARGAGRRCRRGVAGRRTASSADPLYLRRPDAIEPVGRKRVSRP